MCELKRYRTSNTHIDKCMKPLIDFLQDTLQNVSSKSVACCCGHNKYPMTVVIKFMNYAGWSYYELFTGIEIPRSRRFYVRDKQGYYYIPEITKTKR
jgi:hypothetical protein